MIRESDASFIADAVRCGDCVSVVGFSNMGKSTLLRELCTPNIRRQLLGNSADDYLFVYIDCNLMTERSEQALHETTVRAVLTALTRLGAQADLLGKLNNLYHQVVEPATPIRGPLAFDDALREVCEQSGRKLVLLFDEFDDPFEALASRAFLNLRALKDQLGQTLTYITATERSLSSIRDDREAAEFAELFDTREKWIGFLSQTDTQALAEELTQGHNATPYDIGFITRQAGGHSGLIEAVTDVWQRIASGAPDPARTEALELTAQALDDQTTVRTECAKLWAQLSEDERATLTSHFAGIRTERSTLAKLQQKRILPSDGNPQDACPGDVWRAFVKRQALAVQGLKPGIVVDVDSGEVFVDGHKSEPLTDLEYKMLLLLYGRLNKVVDKYTIVTNVWGETYLNEVDDARIEKLISRLRSKLEPGVTEPKYLTTLRGRGYRLVS